MRATASRLTYPPGCSDRGDRSHLFGDMGNTLPPDPEGQEMPWGAMSTKALREEFVRLSAFEGSNIRELCRRVGVSPKMGAKWLLRAPGGGGGRGGGPARPARGGP